MKFGKKMLVTGLFKPGVKKIQLNCFQIHDLRRNTDFICQWKEEVNSLHSGQKIYVEATSLNCEDVKVFFQLLADIEEPNIIFGIDAVHITHIKTERGPCCSQSNNLEEQYLKRICERNQKSLEVLLIDNFFKYSNHVIFDYFVELNMQFTYFCINLVERVENVQINDIHIIKSTKIVAMEKYESFLKTQTKLEEFVWQRKKLTEKLVNGLKSIASLRRLTVSFLEHVETLWQENRNLCDLFIMTGIQSLNFTWPSLSRTLEQRPPKQLIVLAHMEYMSYCYDDFAGIIRQNKTKEFYAKCWGMDKSDEQFFAALSKNTSLETIDISDSINRDVIFDNVIEFITKNRNLRHLTCFFGNTRAAVNDRPKAFFKAIKASTITHLNVNISMPICTCPIVIQNGQVVHDVEKMLSVFDDLKQCSNLRSLKIDNLIGCHWHEVINIFHDNPCLLELDFCRQQPAFGNFLAKRITEENKSRLQLVKDLVITVLAIGKWRGNFLSKNRITLSKDVSRLLAMSLLKTWCEKSAWPQQIKGGEK